MEKVVQKIDGMNYAPVSQGKKHIAALKEPFRFSVIGLDHGHIYAQTNGLLEAGATLAGVFDPDPLKLQAFLARYPGIVAAASEDAIISDPSIALVASAIRPDKRVALGLRVLGAGKDYFADKPGMLSFAEIETIRAATAASGKKYFIYFGERIHVEGALYAEKLIREGAVGRVLHVTILAPHRLNPETRPDWFWDIGKAGGILTDIGSHQIEQFLTYVSAKTARITHGTLANYHNGAHPEFFDYGDCNLVADNGATGFFRLDWFTPKGLDAWGDGRAFIIGTEGTIEIRKYIDVALSPEGDHVYLVNMDGVQRIEAHGLMGFEFFAQMILDCINHTDTAMTQEHILESMRLAIEAQEKAEIIAAW